MLISCAGCERCFHAPCVDSPPDAKSKDKWQCPQCTGEVGAGVQAARFRQTCAHVAASAGHEPLLHLPALRQVGALWRKRTPHPLAPVLHIHCAA